MYGGDWHDVSLAALLLLRLEHLCFYRRGVRIIVAWRTLAAPARCGGRLVGCIEQQQRCLHLAGQKQETARTSRVSARLLRKRTSRWHRAGQSWPNHVDELAHDVWEGDELL